MRGLKRLQQGGLCILVLLGCGCSTTKPTSGDLRLEVTRTGPIASPSNTCLVERLKNAEDLEEALVLLRLRLVRDEHEEYLSYISQSVLWEKARLSIFAYEWGMKGDNRILRAFRREAKPKIISVLRDGNWIHGACFSASYEILLRSHRSTIPALHITLRVPIDKWNPRGPVNHDTGTNVAFPFVIHVVEPTIEETEGRPSESGS